MIYIERHAIHYYELESDTKTYQELKNVLSNDPEKLSASYLDDLFGVSDTSLNVEVYIRDDIDFLIVMELYYSKENPLAQATNIDLTAISKAEAEAIYNDPDCHVYPNIGNSFFRKYVKKLLRKQETNMEEWYKLHFICPNTETPVKKFHDTVLKIDQKLKDCDVDYLEFNNRQYESNEWNLWETFDVDMKALSLETPDVLYMLDGEHSHQL